MIRVVSIVLTLLLASVLPPHTAMAEEYQLNIQDELRIRVLRWDGDRNAFTVLDGVSGDYRVSTDGILSLPLIGSLSAQGQTAPALARQIEFEIERKLGISPAPRVGVEVTGHQPVFVLGEVTSPGSFAYRPGLTAQQALALAGGLVRLQPASAGAFAQDTMRLGGEVRSLAAEIDALQAERTRLLADLQDLENASVSSSKPIRPRPRGIEGDILDATQKAREAQGERLRDLQTVLREQIDRMSEQIKLRSKQIERTSAELADVNALKERGLTVNTRVSALTTALNDLESKRLQLEIARLTARQQLNRAERDTLALTDDARARTLEQLNRVDRDLARLDIRLATAEALRAQAVASGLAVPDPLAESLTEYRVTRVVDGTAVSLEFAPTDNLAPGDTIEISRVSGLPTNSQ
ncbi:polysaccharide biosynthesis/export family protein [Aliiroseovarius sp. F20344]|uniref:polysaccharide biosynthesis/export family protein n=1 Tax=Aliiroseovarius sp. F20344 TaxID=2926414 RepID=UPI001FF0EB99|nr:polysaccharide biosynthesis/export family protein [Aliiroseovarius sp. F20344]MCK0143105.1 polysaccharide biosynthesis/export family protein [Aliiroseovarius sp. F20344]